VGLSRDSYRHPPQANQATQELHERIVKIAYVRRRFGYRRIHDLPRPQLPRVNHKRVYRLYRQANLAVRKRKKAKRPINERTSRQLARTANALRTLDFMSDSLASGRRLKYLTVAAAALSVFGDHDLAPNKALMAYREVSALWLPFLTLFVTCGAV